MSRVEKSPSLSIFDSSSNSHLEIKDNNLTSANNTANNAGVSSSAKALSGLATPIITNSFTSQDELTTLAERSVTNKSVITHAQRNYLKSFFPRSKEQQQKDRLKLVTLVEEEQSIKRTLEAYTKSEKESVAKRAPVYVAAKSTFAKRTTDTTNAVCKKDQIKFSAKKLNSKNSNVPIPKGTNTNASPDIRALLECKAVVGCEALTRRIKLMQRLVTVKEEITALRAQPKL